jgi:hypothetical protein
MPLNPAKSLANKLGDSGIEKPKFEVCGAGLAADGGATGTFSICLRCGGIFCVCLFWGGIFCVCLLWTGMF